MVEAILRSHLVPADRYIYGFADLTGLLDKKFEGFNWGISIGRKLDDNIVNQIIEGPTKEYYQHYRNVNLELAQLTHRISEDLISIGIKPINIDPTITSSDIDLLYSSTLTTDVSHKMVATRSGLGWIGKTDLFVSIDVGPRLRLVSILIDKPLVSGKKIIEKSRCGSCSLCVDICPAKAANGMLWNTSVNRNEFYDPWKCRKQCAEFGRSRLGMDIRLCGICVAICPVGLKKMNKKVRDGKS